MNQKSLIIIFKQNILLTKEEDRYTFLKQLCTTAVTLGVWEALLLRVVNALLPSCVCMHKKCFVPTYDRLQGTA